MDFNSDTNQKDFPLKYIMYLYIKHNRYGRLYLNSYRGLKLLINYLGPIDTSIPEELKNKKLEFIFSNHDIDRIADILKTRTINVHFAALDALGDFYHDREE